MRFDFAVFFFLLFLCILCTTRYIVFLCLCLMRVCVFFFVLFHVSCGFGWALVFVLFCSCLAYYYIQLLQTRQLWVLLIVEILYTGKKDHNWLYYTLVRGFILLLLLFVFFRQERRSRPGGIGVCFYLRLGAAGGFSCPVEEDAPWACLEHHLLRHVCRGGEHRANKLDRSDQIRSDPYFIVHDCRIVDMFGQTYPWCMSRRWARSLANRTYQIRSDDIRSLFHYLL